jgi:GAF domain
MRWFVEVTSLGNAKKESLHVDADTWQGALQTARLLRGDSGAISGFSIDILDDGCRAVDPASQSLYEVRKVSGATSTPPTPSIPPKAPQVSPVSAAPRPMSQTAPMRTRQASGPGPLAGVMASPAVAEATSPPRAVAASGVLAQVVFRREQERSEAVPLTYRECVYLVPEGTTESDAEALLLTQLAQVRASLERVPAGRLVNLAVFDRASHDKPGGLPIATLTWKDWRKEPALAFPGRSRRASQAPPTPPIPDSTAPTSRPRPSSPGPLPPTPGRAPSTPGPLPPTSGSAFPHRGPSETPSVTPALPLAGVGATPGIVPAAASPGLGAPSASEFPPSTPAPGPTSRRGSSPRNRAAGARVRGDELIADLFEAMHELRFLPDAIDGGEFCLTLAMQEIPSQIGIVHLYDIDRREFVVTNARGAGAAALLMQRHGETDPMLAAAMRGRRAVVIADAALNEAATIERYVAVGGVRSVIVAPAMQSGRFLGAIELLNPLDGQPFTDSDGNAVLYIAEQFAEFVAARGVVTDPERIAARRSR